MDIKDKALLFASEHGLDVHAVESAMRGVIQRLEIALSKGETMSDELFKAALLHWHQSQTKYYEELLENKDGQFDDLCEKVYNELKAITNQKD